MSELAKRAPLLPVKAKNEDHGTPEEIWGAVQRVFGQRPDLDPCGNPNAFFGAKRTIWLPKWRPCNEPDCDQHPVPSSVVFRDGLEMPWTGRVYANPPFDHRNLGAFMAKARVESRTNEASVILLAPSKTGLKCWQREVPSAQAVCFINHRLKFIGNSDPALFDCALILWTQDRGLVHRFALELDGSMGHVMFSR